MSGSEYSAFAGAEPYFALVRKALGELVDGEHFFDVVADDIVSGKATPNLARVAKTLAGWAEDHLAHARAERSSLPRSARSALLTVPLAEAYLRRLARARYDLMDTNWSVPRPAVIRLTRRSLTTGY